MGKFITQLQKVIFKYRFCIRSWYTPVTTITISVCIARNIRNTILFEEFSLWIRIRIGLAVTISETCTQRQVSSFIVQSSKSHQATIKRCIMTFRRRSCLFFINRTMRVIFCLWPRTTARFCLWITTVRTENNRSQCVRSPLQTEINAKIMTITIWKVLTLSKRRCFPQKCFWRGFATSVIIRMSILYIPPDLQLFSILSEVDSQRLCSCNTWTSITST